MQTVFEPIISGNRKIVKKLEQQINSSDCREYLEEHYRSCDKLNEHLTKIGVTELILAYKVVDSVVNKTKIPYKIANYNNLDAIRNKIMNLLG